jgi:GNAT superfamily N-acetyltransferase
MVTIRGSRSDDGPVLREIERLAGERFREVGMDAVADDEPASVEVLAEYAIAGRSWVAVDDADRPVGYVLVDIVDGDAHIEQISVRPDHQGEGIGRALIEQVRAWGTGIGGTAITLSTFAEVPWNGPLYEHLGFTVVPDRELGPELRAVRDAETAHGLDPTIRWCMRLPLASRVGQPSVEPSEPGRSSPRSST